MNDTDIYVHAAPAILPAAQTFYNLFVMNLYDRGWMPAVHGSVIGEFNARIASSINDALPHIEFSRHRDIDIILVPIEAKGGYAQRLELGSGQLKQWLIDRMAFDLRIEEERGNLIGWVGLMHTYVIDITVVKP